MIILIEITTISHDLITEVVIIIIYFILVLLLSLLLSSFYSRVNVTV